MVKARMSTADVAAEVAFLRRLIGMRLANVYDLNPKTYLLKLAKSSGVTDSGESEKVLVLLESGVRVHTTQFARDKSATPSGFTLKLRKHIRAKRLEDVRQLGIDRVVDFQFGVGSGSHHLLLELYASGNIMLTDSDYNVLILLRTYRDDESGIAMMTHKQYPISACRKMEMSLRENIMKALRCEAKAMAEEGETGGAAAVNEDTGEGIAIEEVSELGKAADTGWEETKPKDGKQAKDGEQKGGKGRKGVSGEGKRGRSKKGKGEKDGKGGEIEQGKSLKNALADALGYGPALLEHIILDAGLSPGAPVWKEPSAASGIGGLKEEEVGALVESVWRFEKWLGQVATGEIPAEGFITIQNKGLKGTNRTLPDGHATEKLEEVKMYDEFTPVRLHQHAGRETLTFPTFDAAVDDFFSKIEGQKFVQQRTAAENQALSKLERIRADQTKRAEQLGQEAAESMQRAELIACNAADVDAALLAVRGALARGLDWAALRRVVKEEARAGNPVAGLVHSLQLERGRVTLLLSNSLEAMDDEEKTAPVAKVEVDLSLSAYANARMWFDAKKKHAAKREKTVAAHEQVFAAAEKKAQQQLTQAKAVAAISHLRKVHWFEKFYWFVTSENYLVISGRDAQQNELVVKRYLKKGDLYLHADLRGASSTVIKNWDPDSPIPPLSLNQAGAFAVCRSAAWDSKIVTSAWWVYPHQVSKTAPTGEYLTVGSFVIRGRKNFLPPTQLVMGFAFMFRLEESSLAAHLNERRVRGEMDEEDAVAEAVGMSEEELKGMDEPGGRSEEEEGGHGEQKDGCDEALKQGVGSDDGRERIRERDVEEVAAKDRDQEAKEDESNVAAADLDELLDKAFSSNGPYKRRGNNKYGLDEDPDAIDSDGLTTVEEVTGSRQIANRQRPYLSKAERKQSKKGADGKGRDNQGGGGQGAMWSVEGDVDALEGEKHDGRVQKDDEDEQIEYEGGKGVGEEEKEADHEQERNGMKGKAAITGERDNGYALRRGKSAKNDPSTSARRGGSAAEGGVKGDKGGGKGDSEGLKVGRGKRGKIKRAKEKYGEQDEEERRVTMALLASAGRQDKEPERAASVGGGKVEPNQQNATEPMRHVIVCYKCRREGHIARDCPTDMAAAAGSHPAEGDRPAEGERSEKEGRGGEIDRSDAGETVGDDEDGGGESSNHGGAEGDDGGEVGSVGGPTGDVSLHAQERMDDAEVEKLLEEENVQELGEAEKGQLKEQDVLTGVPKAGDVLLYAVPVCAPYSALQGYKYRVKLTPGSAKKGKAAKTAVELFSRLPEASAQEKKLMKVATDPELVAAMVGNVKLTAPGLTKVKASQKKGKKQAAASNAKL